MWIKSTCEVTMKSSLGALPTFTHRPFCSLVMTYSGIDLFERWEQDFPQGKVSEMSERQLTRTKKYIF